MARGEVRRRGGERRGGEEARRGEARREARRRGGEEARRRDERRGGEARRRGGEARRRGGETRDERRGVERYDAFTALQPSATGCRLSVVGCQLSPLASPHAPSRLLASSPLLALYFAPRAASSIISGVARTRRSSVRLRQRTMPVRSTRNSAGRAMSRPFSPAPLCRIP